ncbi:MAG: glycine cleavage T C-terminal barrel domain-containing protein [Myxococcota bacterium]
MISGSRDAVRVIEIVGEAARRFANGQFTNNARDLPVGAHQHTALTDDRGRLQALADLVCLDENRFLLALEGMTTEAFEEQYRMLLLLEDLEVVVRDEVVHTVQDVRDAKVALDGVHWPAPRSIGGGFDVLGALPDAVLASARPAAPGELEALRIQAGWPAWPVDGSDKQLPHELGIRDTHLHFEKGCYRGQEIIHRVDVMGQVRKGLVGLRLSGDAAPGTDLIAGGKKVGRLGSSAQHPTLGLIALGVVRNESAAPGTRLELDGGSAGGADVVSLPMRG